ncbi:phage baseplate assembly protein V [Bradyrhizobium sp.]|uniref:phage baseplate assembly protein V n=1 Tax=Bradyrhizobium sp. TaxID=376 RepID=UPI0039E6E699
MIDQLNRLLAPMQRRIMLAIGRAVLNAVNDSASSQMVQASLLAGEVRDKMERMSEYGFTSVPLPGAQAVSVFVGGERGHGVIIATGDTRYRLKALAGGEVAIYDDQGQKVHLTRDGIVVDGAGKQITFKNAPLARFEMPIEATGTITDLADTAGGRSMDSMRAVYDTHTHHENGAGSNTNQPNQGM